MEMFPTGKPDLRGVFFWISGLDTSEKRSFDQAYLEIGLEENLDPEQAFTAWSKLGQANQHLPWLGDKELFDLLMDRHSPETSFSRSFACRIW